jgi:hypothetical protein
MPRTSRRSANITRGARCEASRLHRQRPAAIDVEGGVRFLDYVWAIVYLAAFLAFALMVSGRFPL